MFELTNEQRQYFGLPPIPETWSRRVLTNDTYRSACTLLFDGNTFRRTITSTEKTYSEVQYKEETRDKEFFLPKTSRGMEKRITQSTLESKTPIGVYINLNQPNQVLIGNHTTQQTFYATNWEYFSNTGDHPVSTIVDRFINESPKDHLSQIKDFSFAKRRNVRYGAGDIFRFRLNRKEYGFGIILLDVNALRKKNLISSNHGLRNLMGPPLLIRFYAVRTENLNFDLEKLNEVAMLPSDYIMDNAIFYGEHELVGHKDLVEDDFDFPVSYGRSLEHLREVVFLQWGLIHLELPLKKFDKFLEGEIESLPTSSPSRKVNNPFGYYSIGFRSKFNSSDIYHASDIGRFSYEATKAYQAKFDLRNPINKPIKDEIFRKFGIAEDASYFEVAKRLQVADLFETISSTNELARKK
jgi:Immunity protein 26